MYKRQIFGDGLAIYANPELLPEQSDNYNLDISNTTLFSTNKLRAKLGFFYRDVDNFIDDVFQVRGLAYENTRSVLIYGGEASFSFEYAQKASFTINLTRQYILNNVEFIEGTQIENRVFGDQLPNEPYLFGNLSFSYNLIDTDSLGLVLNYDFNYVHEFFLGYESIATAADKNVIPEQQIHSLGTTLNFNENKYSLSLECNNVFNDLVFDNFNIQNPGRSFSLKLRYNL